MLVFLSHDSADKPTARRIRDALVDRGLRVWIDEIDVRVGQSIPEEVARGIDAAEAFCLLISAASQESRWVSREANAFLMQALLSGGLILPCRLDDTTPPTLIADIKYADFRASFNDGLAALFHAIGVREAINEAKETERVVETLLSTLNADELAFFVAYFETSDHYFVGDGRESRAPHKLLDSLAAAGVVHRQADRREVQWDLNNRGREVLKRVKARVPSGDLDRVTAWIRQERL
jgi:hypothetical protein